MSVIPGKAKNPTVRQGPNALGPAVWARTVLDAFEVGPVDRVAFLALALFDPRKVDGAFLLRPRGKSTARLAGVQPDDVRSLVALLVQHGYLRPAGDPDQYELILPARASNGHDERNAA